MKRKTISFAIIAAMVILTLVGCNGSKTTTSTSPAATTPTATLTKTTVVPTTTQVPGGTPTPTTSTTLVSPSPTPTTSKPPTNSTTTPPPTSPTTSAGKILPTIPPVIKDHSASDLNALKDSCLMCHGKDNPYQFPLPPTWDATKFMSTTYSGVFTITPGANNDHTGRTNDLCLTCNTKP
jgi:hypothetical protein